MVPPETAVVDVIEVMSVVVNVGIVVAFVMLFVVNVTSLP
jgi:hypothetical protein